MEDKASAARSDLEAILSDETAEPMALQLSLLEDITGGFSDEQVIGSGGFAVVYKGILKDRAVAVKRLSKAYMHEMEFHREVQCLMLVKHKNVIRFLGYCADTQGNMAMYNGKLVMADVHQRLLCFEYMPEGSLDKYITGNDHVASNFSRCFPSKGPRREWGTCYKIIKGICEGLLYLHENHIVHLDLKPANILLDNNMVPKIADFGLSRCFEENQSQYITRTIVGTMGYLAPEFREAGVITRSTDLYSLGVVIIEILTGQKGYQSIRDVLEGWSNRLRPQGNTECEQIRLCYEIGLECIDFIPDKRPASVRNIIDRLLEMRSPQNLGSTQTAEAAASTSEAAAATVTESNSKAGGATCPNCLCCSRWGWCGSSDLYCGDGCQSQCSGCGPAPPRPPTPTPPTPTPPAPPGDGVASIVSSDLFERLLLHRNDAACPARGFYTYESFIAAAASFPGFGTTGSTEARKREVAAFLGQTSHETTGGWPTAPDGPYSWGYCYKQELHAGADYCVPSTEWPCAPGKKYYGRGPIQLSYNYNYGPAGRAIGVDLLSNPDLVATDPVVSFKTALWFWMTPQAPKPSCHAVITGQWSPTPSDTAAGRVPGYGVITNIINGGLECRIGPDARVADRIGFYQRYCDLFGISYGTNLDCYTQLPFNRGLSSLAAAQ